MRCCVTNCKNDSRNISKSQGITFHVFPNNQSLRSSWLKALGRETWEPKERSAVCSLHFLRDDLYETSKGLRKVKFGAVPMVLQEPSKWDVNEGADLKIVCRICLVMEGRMFSLRRYNLEKPFEQLTGISFQGTERSNFPVQVCVECFQRLLSYQKFRQKTLISDRLLMEIVKQHETINVTNIKLINRKNNLLTSNLSCKINETDHYDMTFEHIDEIEDKKEESHIKLEEEDNQEEQNDSNDDANAEIFVNDFDLPKSDVSEKDCSSDDSIPLIERCKRVKSKRLCKKTVGVKRVKAVKQVNVEPKIDRRRKPFLNQDLNETLFTVTDLTEEEQKAEIEKRQQSSNYKNGVYKCNECYKGFLDEEAYVSHMSRHTNECGEHRCSICKTHFKHSHALRKHITAHHTQRFSCNQCMYVTTHRQSARLHERWHKGTKYKCPHCTDEFVKFTTYMGHIRIKHPSDFVCQLCGFSFVSEKGIMLHKKLKHRQEDILIPEDAPFCDLCNLKFVNTDALKRHLSVSARHSSLGKNTRQPNKPTKNRRLRDKRTREEETSINDDIRKVEDPIPCEQCGLQLEDSRAYHGHFRRMHPDKNRTNYPSMKSPCMCEVCGRIFQSYALLKDHRWVHTDERPFKCDACGKSFRMKQRLVAHLRVHSAMKATYGCELCGKQFSTHSNRQRHMFIHTGLKPFKCEMCDKGFKHASEKRAHITYVHLKKPWPKRNRGKRRHDGRQVPLPAQQLQGSGSEMDVQGMWPCGPKIDLQPSIDKPFYTMKI